jgi:signal transduction histidine kinase
MIEERFGPIGNDRYRQYLKDIHASGGQLIALINDLLDLTRIESGKLDLSFTDVAVNDLAQQCVALMQPQANRERVIIRSALSPKLPHVVADARSVHQILLNLLSNAIKFSDAGEVVVSTRENGESISISIADSGIGIAAENLERIFAPFWQVEQRSTRRVGGTGLGLSVSRSLARLLGGDVSVESTADGGSTFTVSLPRQTA